MLNFLSGILIHPSEIKLLSILWQRNTHQQHNIFYYFLVMIYLNILQRQTSSLDCVFSVYLDLSCRFCSAIRCLDCLVTQ